MKRQEPPSRKWSGVFPFQIHFTESQMRFRKCGLGNRDRGASVASVGSKFGAVSPAAARCRGATMSALLTFNEESVARSQGDSPPPTFGHGAIHVEGPPRTRQSSSTIRSGYIRQPAAKGRFLFLPVQPPVARDRVVVLWDLAIPLLSVNEPDVARVKYYSIVKRPNRDALCCTAVAA